MKFLMFLMWCLPVIALAIVLKKSGDEAERTKRMK